MVRLEDLDIFKVPAQVLVAPVNAVGIPGAGLALAFAQKYPDWATYYKAWCKASCPIQTATYERDGLLIYSAVTKHQPRDPSNVTLIMNTCNLMRTVAVRDRWQSAAVPALGCGLGGLDWRKVIPFMCKLLDDTPTEFIICLPRATGRP